MAIPTLKQLQDAASQCQTKTEFRTQHPRFYKYAWRKNLLDELCGHMTDQRVKWTKTKVAREAKKYQRRSEFAESAPRAYHAARNRGWLEDVCQHMEAKKDTIYMLQVEDTNTYKIGMTSSDLGLQRIETLRRKINRPLKLLLYVTFPERITQLETRCLRYGKGSEDPELTKHSSEFMDLTDKEFNRIIDLIAEERKK